MFYILININKKIQQTNKAYKDKLNLLGFVLNQQYLELNDFFNNVKQYKNIEHISQDELKLIKKEFIDIKFSLIMNKKFDFTKTLISKKY